MAQPVGVRCRPRLMSRRRLIAAARVWSCCWFGWAPRYRSFRWPLATTALVAKCAAFRLRPASVNELTATKQAMRSVARRIRALATEIAELKTSIAELVTAAAPQLLQQYGIAGHIRPGSRGFRPQAGKTGRQITEKAQSQDSGRVRPAPGQGAPTSMSGFRLNVPKRAQGGQTRLRLPAVRGCGAE